MTVRYLRLKSKSPIVPIVPCSCFATIISDSFFPYCFLYSSRVSVPIEQVSLRKGMADSQSLDIKATSTVTESQQWSVFSNIAASDLLLSIQSPMSMRVRLHAADLQSSSAAQLVLSVTL